MKKPADFLACAEQLRAVADPERLRIVTLLLQGEKNVSEICEALGEEIVKVSHHLGVLRRAELAVSTRKGRFAVYALHPEVFIAPTGPNDEPQLQFGCCQLSLSRDPAR